MTGAIQSRVMNSFQKRNSHQLFSSHLLPGVERAGVGALLSMTPAQLDDHDGVMENEE